MKKIQQILTLVLSLGFIAVFAALFWILPDADESTVERRHLAKCPTLSFSSVANGSFMNGFEKYMLDQFPLRDGFRTLKAAANAKVFMQKDNNGLYSVGEHLSKLDFSTDFYDYGGHVNALGEGKCTEFLRQYLDSHYELPDRRSVQGYESWDSAWKLYQQKQSEAEASCRKDIEEENWAPEVAD